MTNKIVVAVACVVIRVIIPSVLRYLNQPTDQLNPIATQSAHFAALILARGGSKGIPHKNLARIENITLITRTLTTIKNFGKFNSIWVSTDSRLIEEESLKTPGVQVHLRSPESASDTASSLTAVLEFLERHEEIDIVALIQCTSPMLKETYLDKAYVSIERGYDSVFSLTRQHKLRWRMTRYGLEPQNFVPSARFRRQDWAGELVENGMFYFSHSRVIQRDRTLQGGRSTFVEIEDQHSLEIDTEFDLRLAQLLIESEHL